MNKVGDEVVLGQLLQDARKKAGLTQQELCHKAGLSYSTLAKIERGAIKSPSIFTIQNIAAALGTTLNDLIGVLAPSLPQQAKKRSKSGIRFVYFDINGCLVQFYHRAFTEIARDSGKQAEVVETTFWHYNDEVCRGEMPVEELNRILGESFDLPDFDWLKYYFAAIDPVDEMKELITWASEHYNIGLLSNIMPGQIKTMLSMGLIPNVPYSAIIDSSEVKTIKPEERIFEIAAEKAGVAPGEILFVDDSRANIMAAAHLGWHVLWFDAYRPDECTLRIREALEFEN